MPVITRSQKKAQELKNTQDLKNTQTKLESQMCGQFKKLLTKAEENTHDYDKLRIITEIYYYVFDWFDVVFITNGVVATPAMQRLINTVFLQQITLRHELKVLSNSKFKNPTKEQKYIIKVFLDQLIETSKKLAPYVTST